VIVAPNMTRAAASERAVLLSRLAREAGMDVCGADFLSLSVGAAFYPQDAQDAEQLLAEADRTMYAAKQWHYERLGERKRNEGAPSYLAATM
jgi:GGDEF domain-containing protein